MTIDDFKETGQALGADIKDFITGEKYLKERRVRQAFEEELNRLNSGFRSKSSQEAAESIKKVLKDTTRFPQTARRSAWKKGLTAAAVLTGAAAFSRHKYNQQKAIEAALAAQAKKSKLYTRLGLAGVGAVGLGLLIPALAQN